MSQPSAQQQHVDGYAQEDKKRDDEELEKAAGSWLLRLLKRALSGGEYAEPVSKTEIAATVPLIKDESRHIVYGIVLQPEVRDSQGDILDAETIEKACHDFMVASRKADVQHSEDHNPGIMLLENYIAPHDMTLGQRPVLKGSWVQGWKVDDAETWGKIVKDEITGLSMGGSGVRLAE